MRPLVAAGVAVAIAAASVGGWWLSRPEKAPQAAAKGGGARCR